MLLSAAGVCSICNRRLLLTELSGPPPPPSPALPQGPYITEAGTPVADMWEAQFGHLDKKKARGAASAANALLCVQQLGAG